MALRGALTLLLLWRAGSESGATEDEAAWLQLPLKRSRASLAQLCVPGADGNFNFDLATGLECMRQVTLPLDPALQSLRALAAFYEEFYVFETTAVDPAKPLHKALPGWEDLGQWGTAHGGGDAPNATKTPLVAGLRALADSLEAEGADPAVPEFFGPANELLNGIRDCHNVDVWKVLGGGDDAAGAPLMMGLLGAVKVELQAEGGDLVRLKVENALAAVPDGAAAPRVLDQRSGREVRALAGMPPMEWLVSKLVRTRALPRYHMCQKSLGVRVNSLLRTLASGLSADFGAMGSLEGLQGPIAVGFEDGTEAAWSFRLYVHGSKGATWQKVTSVLKEKAGQTGRFRELLEQVKAQAKASWHVSRTPPSLLGHLALPAQGALAAAFPAGLPQNKEQWYMGSSFEKVYGYFEARTDPEGQSYMLWKMATFHVPMQGPAEDPLLFKAFWARLIEAAKATGATRLIVDVAGNSGGNVGLAFSFIAALTAPLGLGQLESCVYYRAPVRRSYEMWRAMDRGPVLAFLNSAEAISERFPLISEELWSRFEVLLRTAAEDFLPLTEADMEAIGFRNQDSAWVLPKPGSAQELQQLFARLISVTQSNIHVGNILGGSPFNLGMVSGAAEPYANAELLHQGGIARNFTRKVPTCAPVEEFRGALAHPFEQVLLLSDGTCGSSCDTATRNSYLFSRLAEQRGGKGLRVRYITFGGPGGSATEAKEVLGGTSFPGGNANDHVTGYFKNALAQTLLIMAGAKLAGEEALFQQGLAYARFLGSLVPEWASAEPAYAETAAYSKLGLEVPDEFLFLPTDLYLPSWYYGVTGDEPAGWNATELARMHADAARAFAAF